MNCKLYKALAVAIALMGIFIGPASAQRQQGFVQQDVIRVAGVTTDSMVYTLSVSQKQSTRTYIDGLGRSIQSIAVQASPLQNDLIHPAAYDNLGRPVAGYLPYAGKSADTIGRYRANAVSTDQPAFYNQTTQYLIPVDTAAHANNIYENTPLQRLLKSGMVGNGFQPEDAGTQHYKTLNQRFNKSATDGNILIWNHDGTFTANNYYVDNTLFVSDAKDEDNVETLVFSDEAGHTILKRQILSTGNLDTYYVYNWAGMLIYIVPPAATNILSANSYNLRTAPIANLVFYYTYDSMGRITTRKVPAKGTTYVIYDPMNRPVLSQDSNMHASNRWAYVKYDVKGRVVNTGTYTDATYTTPAAMQGYVNTLAGSYNSAWFESRTTASTFNYYTSSIFPTVNLTSLTFSYYDDYDPDNNGAANFSYSSQGLTGEVGATTAQVKGMPTVILTSTVGPGISAGQWYTKVVFYDKRGNVVQTKSANHLYFQGTFATTDISTVVPDFLGVPQITKVSKQTSSTVTTTVQTNISYDHRYRVTNVSQGYNGGAMNNIAAYTYNELGQLVKKNLQPLSSLAANITRDSTNSVTSGSTTTVMASNGITFLPGFKIASGATYNAYISSGALQSVDYRYNIRGQLLSINNSKLSNDGGVTNSDGTDVFGMQLLYDQTDASLGNTASYSGRVSAVKWMSGDGAGSTSYERAFNYYYDQLGRDTAAIYAERTALSSLPFTITHGWDENRITYDPNGNIKTLYRNSATQGASNHSAIDNLTYTYSGTNPNQLASVADASGSSQGFIGGSGTYTYDGNGNLMSDPYKGLSFGNYNVLNKTDKITMTAGTYRWIDYTYDASGNLLRKRQYDNNSIVTTTDYIDGFVYQTAGAGTPVLQYLPMPEGRVVYNGSAFVPTYTINDMQGNARVEFDNSGTGGTLHLRQENSYYAFGLIMPGSVVATPTNPNKKLYNGGSEWQNDFGNLPDYYQTFFRNYDAALGRWVGVDPMAESAESMTTYQYAGNNPVMFNDPNGDLAKTPPSAMESSGDGHSISNFSNGVYDQIVSDLGDFESGSGAGLYYTDPGAYWNLYSSTGGNFGGASAYHAGNGTDDPRTGMSDIQLAAMVHSNGQINIGSGQISFTSKGGYINNPNWNKNDEGSTKLDNLEYLSLDGKYNISFSGANQGGMTLSASGLDFVARHEGFGDNGLNPYNDQHNFATVGYGHLLHKSPVTAADRKKYRGMTEAEGRALLATDVSDRVNELNSLLKVSVTQWQFDALFDMAFRNGMGAFGRSQLLRDINAGLGSDTGLITGDFEQWTDHGHQVIRDQDEIELYFNNDYNYRQ